MRERTNHRLLPSFVFGVLVLGVGILGVACGGGPKSAAKSTPRATATCYDGGLEAPSPEETKVGPFEGPMVVVEATKLEDELRAAGLDPKSLPPLEKIDRKQIGKVMKTFSTSLGIACVGCHDADDFKKPTPRKRVAKRMWNDFVRVLATDDGKPVYCDSCHQGRLLALDRRNKKVVADYMDDIFLGKLKRADGKEHDCGTCHGDPPEFHFLDEWKKATP